MIRIGIELVLVRISHAVVARVAPQVTVGVELARIECCRAIIAGIRDPVGVGVLANFVVVHKAVAVVVHAVAEFTCGPDGA